MNSLDETIDRLRGQLQNTVNHLERLNRNNNATGRGSTAAAIESANRALLYEILNGGGE